MNPPLPINNNDTNSSSIEIFRDTSIQLINGMKLSVTESR